MVKKFDKSIFFIVESLLGSANLCPTLLPASGESDSLSLSSWQRCSHFRTSTRKYSFPQTTPTNNSYFKQANQTKPQHE